MPKLAVRHASDVPSPSNVSRAVREQQQVYEEFVRSVGSDVGELELTGDDRVRSIKVHLRRAATRLGTELTIWDADGRVYFKAENRPRRGRPRKSPAA